MMEASYYYLQSIIDGVAEPVMVIGADFRIQFMNKAASDFVVGGISPPEAEFCYQVSHHVDTPCNSEQHPCPLEQACNSGEPVTMLHEHYQAGGEMRLVEVIASPIWEPDGKFLGIVELMRDITEQVKAEEALKEAVGRQRALTAQLAEVEDAERHRLARELHDQVGQSLTALGIQLNIIKNQLPDNNVGEISSRLEDSLLLVDDTTERIRSVMMDLRPPVLDDYGLAAALHWYGQQFNWRTQIEVAISAEALEPRLPRRVEIALFRIVQEALTNVAKHAQASRVEIRMQNKDGVQYLTITDDGAGFDPELTMQHGDLGWGLLTIHQRAESIGGRYSIESKPGIGTKMIIEVERQ